MKKLYFFKEEGLDTHGKDNWVLVAETPDDTNKLEQQIQVADNPDKNDSEWDKIIRASDTRQAWYFLLSINNYAGRLPAQLTLDERLELSKLFAKKIEEL